MGSCLSRRGDSCHFSEFFGAAYNSLTDDPLGPERTALARGLSVKLRVPKAWSWSACASTYASVLPMTRWLRARYPQYDGLELMVKALRMESADFEVRDPA